MIIEASAELLGKLESIYQEGVRIAEQEARFADKSIVYLHVSLLSKAKEKLEILAALRQASELHGEQKRKRKDAPTDIQPSKTKKARMYVRYYAQTNAAVMRFGWARKWPFIFQRRNNLMLNGFSVMSSESLAIIPSYGMKYKILNQMIMARFRHTKPMRVV